MGARVWGIAAAVVFALTAPAAAQVSAAEQAWAADIAAAEAKYAADKRAILKIDDAVYLRPGQSAWLVGPRPPAGKAAWRMEPANGAILSLTYTSSEAVFFRDGAVAKRFDPDDGGEITVEPGLDVRAQITQVAPGETGLRVFAYNQDNPAAKAFKGLDYFPYAAAYAVDAAFEPQTAEPVDFQTSRGAWKRFWRVGTASFSLRGQPVRLPMYSTAATPEGEVSAFFTDATTGKATYNVGRYLDASFEGAFPPKTLRLDFNYAYNPLCARTPHYNCPYAQDELPAAVEAGEKAPPPS